MKKLSQINEGFWKSGINRSKTDALRLEDIENTNLDDIMRIPFALFEDVYFSDRDLILKKDGKNIRLFDEEQMRRLLKIAKERGWRLPTCDEICNNLLDEKGKLDSRCFDDKIIFHNPTGFELRIYDFNSNSPNALLQIEVPRSEMFPVGYWLEDGEMYFGIEGIKRKKIDLKVNREVTNTPKRIRLIKEI